MKHVGSLGNTFIDKYNREARETGKAAYLYARAGTSDALMRAANVRSLGRQLPSMLYCYIGINA